MPHGDRFFRRIVQLTLLLLGVLTFLLLRRDDVDVNRTDVQTARMATELHAAALRADMCTGANAVGVGLQGEYFGEASLRGGSQLARVDEVVDFDASIRSTAGIAGHPVASVRWRGWVKAPLSGQYRFHADAPHMRVSVAQKIVAGTGAASSEGVVALDAGRFYPIEVVVDQIAASDSRIRLEWTAPHGARYVVPKALLHLPTEVVAAKG